MANDVALVSPEQVVMGRAQGRAREAGWEVGTKESEARTRAQEAQVGCYQERGPGTLLGSPFFAKRGKALGSGSSISPGKTRHLHRISTSDETTFRGHLSAHSLTRSPSLARQASPQEVKRQPNWDVLHDTGSLTGDATDTGHLSWSLLCPTVLSSFFHWFTVLV